MFAFGQTGAGKTYTMVGPGPSIGEENCGLLSRSLDFLYNELNKKHIDYLVRISCLEIYHEQVYDLFSDERERSPLVMRESVTDGFYLEGCKLHTCKDYQYAEKLVDIAFRNRQVGGHDVNSRSTRSHCIIDIYIDTADSNKNNNNSNTKKKKKDDDKIEYKISGRLCLVDLAGSERLKSTNSKGKVLQEAGFINKSLYVLGKVIAGLVRTGGNLNHRDVPYRDSKLTKLLITSLGGHKKTLLIACVTEATGSQAETIRTLQFSNSCARIRNKPIKFVDPQQALISELKEEIRRLRNENKKLRQSLSSPLDNDINQNNDMMSLSAREYNNNDDNSISNYSSIIRKKKKKKMTHSVSESVLDEVSSSSSFIIIIIIIITSSSSLGF